MQLDIEALLKPIPGDNPAGSDIQFSPEFANDFPVYMQVSKKYGMLYILTKFGFLFIYELTTCSMVLRARVS